MAGLEPLIPHIYHEEQQEGSMLCAQHALNSLLQGPYFTAPDLSELGRNLDALEETYDNSNTGSSSTNMDDTGFFSVQVLDNALEVWGLNITRWRSESMKPYHDHPHTQLGFILNLEQHWFTLRRFGLANPHIDLDDGNGHWFNLNSFLSRPEWVGKTYLGMVLQQAETEGYSVFAVTQADPDAPLALSRTEADIIASSLAEPDSASTAHLQHSFAGRSKVAAISGTAAGTSAAVDFEDEDYELQAALQASLMNQEMVQDQEVQSSPLLQPPIPHSNPFDLQPTQQVSSRGPAFGSHTPRLVQASDSISESAAADVDPVTASMERNRVLLQRMRQQQEFAQREMWSESDLTPEEQHALTERRERRRRQEEEEEEELRLALEESEALTKTQQRQRETDTHADMDYIDHRHRSDSANDPMLDDDDAELQAALKASLETPSQAYSGPPDTDDVESVLSESTDNIPEPTTEAPSVDEIRRRRLARFGL